MSDDEIEIHVDYTPYPFCSMCGQPRSRIKDLRLQIADLETANQQLHHDLIASREIVALLQQDR